MLWLRRIRMSIETHTLVWLGSVMAWEMITCLLFFTNFLMLGFMWFVLLVAVALFIIFLALVTWRWWWSIGYDEYLSKIK